MSATDKGKGVGKNSSTAEAQEQAPQLPPRSPPGQGEPGSSGTQQQQKTACRDTLNAINELKMSIRANEGWKTRRREKLTALTALVVENPSKSARAKLDLAHHDWETKAEELETLYDSLADLDPANKTKYVNRQNAVAREIADVARTVAEAGANNDDDEIREVEPTARAPGIRIRTDLQPETLSSEANQVEFRAWADNFETYFMASNLRLATAREQQLCLIKLLDGELKETITQNVERTRAVFQHQLLDRDGLPRTDLASCMQLLEEHFESKNPINLRRLEFSKMQQANGQTLGQFATAARGVWLECDFQNLDPNEWLLTILANGCKSGRYKDKLRELRGRPWREIKETISHWEADNNENKSQFEQAKQATRFNKPKQNIQQGTNKNQDKCYRCNKPGHKSPDCRLPKDVECNTCGKKGHIAAACMSKGRSQQQKQGKARQVQTGNEEKADPNAEEIGCGAVGAGQDTIYS